MFSVNVFSIAVQFHSVKAMALKTPNKHFEEPFLTSEHLKGILKIHLLSIWKNKTEYAVHSLAAGKV